MKKLVAIVKKVEGPLARTGLFVACLSLTFMMALEVVNAIGRKLLKPVPVTVETAESLMITTIFWGSLTLLSTRSTPTSP